MVWTVLDGSVDISLRSKDRYLALVIVGEGELVPKSREVCGHGAVRMAAVCERIFEKRVGDDEAAGDGCDDGGEEISLR